MKTKRASGILLHITSLPSRFGIGDFGRGAYRFADFLQRAGQSYWQILPLNRPTMDSPYSSLSAFAGNTLLISPELLSRDGFLTEKKIKRKPAFSEKYVDFGKVISCKTKLFDIAYDRFKDSGRDSQYEIFRHRNKYWLEDYAFFMALREYFGNGQWNNWPKGIRDRNKDSVASLPAT